MFPSAFMRLVLTRRAGWFHRVRLLSDSGTMLPHLRGAAALCGRILTNRWQLIGVVGAKLVVARLPCLASPEHPLKLTPCFWDVVLLPSKFVSGVVQAVAWLAARMATELAR